MTTTIRRTAAIAATLTTLAAVPAAAQTPAPTLSADRPCYSPGDLMTLTGAGYTPSGSVSLSFTGKGVGFFQTGADAAGKLLTELRLPDDNVDKLLDDDEGTREILLAAIDDKRAQESNGGPGAGAAIRVKLSRFGVAWNQEDDDFEPGRRLALEAVGFTGLAGKPLYLHYVRNGDRVATVRLGLLRGSCGTLNKTLRRAFPKRIARPGRWTLLFSPSRVNPTPQNGLWLRIPVRIRR